MRQLAQRITARYHLTPLDAAETETYVRHRMAVAGCARMPFSRLGLKALYQRSGGVPRLINIVADRALMAGYAREQSNLGERLVNRAADEALPGHARYWLHRYGRWALAAAILVAIVGGAAWLRSTLWHVPTSAPVTMVTAQPAPVDAEAQRLEARLAQAPETELTAFSQLLARWQVDSDQVSVRAASRCPQLVAPGIACLHGHAALDQLARFDRPLLLVLGKAEHPEYALLQGVGPKHVRLDLTGTRYELARSSLSKFWSGDFIALWRLPSEVPASLSRGDSGPSIGWVQDRLATFDNGAATKARTPTFDADTEARVRKLQTAYGITADGIIGPETLFALSALDDAGPHLARTVE